MRNLKIRIAGELAELGTDFSCELQKNSPMFLRDEVIGDYAPELNLPFTVRNDAILQYYRHPQVLGNAPKLYCEQYVNTNLLAKGYVMPLEVVDSYKLGFTSNLAEAFGNLRTMSLKKVSFGTIAVPTNLDTTIGNTYNSGGFVFPTVKNPDFFQTPPTGFSGLINAYSGGYTTGPNVPMFFLRFILDKIAELVGYQFSYDTPEINRFVIYNTMALNGSSTIFINNHLPELTVGSFLLEVAKLTNSALFFDTPNRKLSFRTRKSVYTAECTLDWSKKAKPIVGKVPMGFSGLELSSSLDSDDATTKVQNPNFDSYLTAGAVDNLYKVQTVWSSLVVDAGLPYSLQQGIVPGQSDKKFSPRLLQWAGNIGGTPLAVPEYGGLSLFWNGANGLYNTYYKEEEAFLLNTFRTPPVRLYLSESDLARWTPDKKVHINGVNYLFEKIECPLHDLSLGCLGHGYRVA